MNPIIKKTLIFVIIGLFILSSQSSYICVENTSNNIILNKMINKDVPLIQNEKNVFFIPITNDPLWHEFSYLAAIPASNQLSGSKPSVIALDSFGIITNEIHDYLNRYNPDQMYIIGEEAEWSEGHWKLDEGSDTIINDYSENSNHGTIYGAEWIDNNLLFDGLDDYALIQNYYGITNSSERTVSAWINTTTTDTVILSWGNISNYGERWVLRIQEDGYVCVDIGNAYIVGSTNVSDGSWHQIAARFSCNDNPSINTIELFVDDNIEVISEIYDAEADSISNGLMGYWKMDDGHGFTTGDSSFYNNNGVLYTNDAQNIGDMGPEWDSNGKIGSCLYFRRLNENWVDVANESHFDVYDQFSIAFWVKFYNDGYPNQGIVCKGTGYDDSWHFEQNAGTSKIMFIGQNESGETIPSLISNTDILSDNNWGHVTVTFDYRDTQTMTMYTNGAYDTSYDLLQGPLQATDHPLRFGSKTWGGPTGFFNGCLDEIAFWNRVITPSEIAELYNENNGMEINLSGVELHTTADQEVTIGMFNNSYYFEGYISDVRIYNDALSDKEMKDCYLHRFQNHSNYIQIPSSSLDEVTCYLAETFWTSSEKIVICDDKDYANALSASGLAGRLQSPMLYYNTSFGLSTEVLTTIENLGTPIVILVGNNSMALDQLYDIGLSVIELTNDKEVIEWMQNNGLDIDYLATVNPNDRLNGVVKKSSLAASLLATGRDGAVVNLLFNTEWKHPFWANEKTSSYPMGAPTSETGLWYYGNFSLGENSYDFVIANSNDNEYYNLLNIDFNDNNFYGDPGEGPFESADIIEIEGKRYAVTVGVTESQTQGHIKFTYPSYEEMKENLEEYYDLLPLQHPNYMCIVGLQDTIPFGLANGYYSYNDVEDIPTDSLIANVDDDPFFEIAIGRIFGEHPKYTTLLASRSLTYDDLIGDPDIWATRMIWVGTFWNEQFMTSHKLENVGFYPAIIYEENPLYNKSRASVIVQDDHGGCGGFDADWHYYMEDLLAPSIFDVGGCSVAGLDEDTVEKQGSVRMLRNGAIAFTGSMRGSPIDKNQYRQDFWNTIALGGTTGEAHRYGLNNMKTTYFEETWNSGYIDYCLNCQAFYGDPAVNIYIPSEPVYEPAYIEANGSTLTVIAPEIYWIDNESDSYYITGPGLHPDYSGPDQSLKYFYAVWNTNMNVNNMTQDPSVPSPLGWPTGDYFIDEHRDGTRSINWRVRFFDFDETSGDIIEQVDQIQYYVNLSKPPPVANFSYYPHNPLPNETVFFNSTSYDLDGYIVNWTWSMGDNTTLHGENVTHSYSSNGSYIVNLTISDNESNTAMTSKIIYIGTTGVLTINQSIFDRGFPIRHAADGDWAAAQNFTSTMNTFTRAEIYLRKFGNPEFNLTVELRTDHPEGTLLDTLIFTPAEIQSNWYWLTLDFEDQSVTPETDIFIVCPPAPSGVTTSFGYEWGYAFGNQYDGGAFWFTRDGGSLWRDLPTSYEFVFKTYGYD